MLLEVLTKIKKSLKRQTMNQIMSKKVQERRKVGWQNDRDIENLIRNDIDDFFFEELRGRRGIMLDPTILDGIVDEMLGTARTRLAL